MFGNILFLVSALFSVLGAVGVVATKNIMHACVYLLMSLIGVAGLYLTLGADFVAATQLVVYVGGVVILMVFAVMLTGGADSQKSNRFGIKKTPMMGSIGTYIAGGISAILASYIVIFRLLPKVFEAQPVNSTMAFDKTVEKIGMLLVSDHVLAFEISSVLLLGALVGAAVIARPKRN
ncbi:MAG: hypothetical protein CME68_04890 [Halobacteriovoraceae bacterium]|nr:hypothetical protein [Halobacteriovoraceae bacterium]